MNGERGEGKGRKGKEEGDLLKGWLTHPMFQILKEYPE